MAANNTTVIEVKDEKDASPKAEKRSGEYTMIVSGEDATEHLDDTEKTEKLAQDSIQESQELMQHEHSKTMAWNQMLLKIEAKKLAALAEDFLSAHRLKEEIDELKNQLNAMDKEWTEKKTKEKEWKEECEAYEMGKLMRRETLIKISAAKHEGHDFWILVKHNQQIQFEFMSRKGAGWSNGTERTQEEIEEFSKKNVPKSSSNSSNNW